MSNGIFRHWNAEILRNGSADDGKGILLLQFPASLHRGRPGKKWNLFTGVVGTGIGRIIAVIRRQNQQQQVEQFLQAAESLKKLGFTTQELAALLQQKEEASHD